MLIYTYKLEKYIKSKIFPKILLLPNKYEIKGSFRRKIPYVTDIDVVNTIYPQINKSNIYEYLIKLINNMQREKDNIILVYITCGNDDRFKIDTASTEEIDKIRPLLLPNEQVEIDSILEKYKNNSSKKIFYLNELIWNYYKLRWTPEEVLSNKKTLRWDIMIKFTDIVAQNSVMLLQYYVKIGSYPIGIDAVINYEPINMTEAYKSAAKYHLSLANYAREYYYMLFPFKYYFRKDKKISTELNDLIEKKFGLYKQLMVRIDTYETLYKSNNLDIQTATGIVTSILKDLRKLPNFITDVPNKIQAIAENNTPDVKMAQWDTLLGTLYDEINATVNNSAKSYFFKYLEMLPKNIQENFYLKNLREARDLSTERNLRKKLIKSNIYYLSN